MRRAAALAATLLAASTVSGQVVPTDTIAFGNVHLLHWSGNAALAERLAVVAGEAPPLPGLSPTALDSGPPIDVVLAPDEESWQALTGGRSPDWGAGVAMPSLGLIILPAYASDRGSPHELPRVLRHELAHVALRRHLGTDPPRWFSEGYAVWAAGQFDTEAAWLLRVAFLLRRAPPLDSLTLDWPAGATEARVAYLLSASVLDYLYRAAGDRGLELLLDRWRLSGSLEGSLRATYGLTLGQLERYWGRDVRRRYGWLLFAAQSTVIWLIVSAAVVVMWLIRRRHNRRRMERLRDDELPDEPAFWKQPPEDAESPFDGGDRTLDDPRRGP